MAVTMFVVKATIEASQEEAFNHWYNTEHCPQLLQYGGAVSAKRYKALLGEDKFQYMAVYEFESEETFERFLASDHFAKLKEDYELSFGAASERARFGYVQVWP